jgi:hypothetical protein
MPENIARIKYLNPEGWEWKSLYDLCRGTFLAPHCYEFAIACHDGLGWPLVGYRRGEEMWHAGVRAPDGTLFDARGFVEEDAFGAPFEDEHPAVVPLEKNDLRRTEGGYAADNDAVIRCATRFAHALWPTLPWKETNAMRLAAFLTKLDELCREYGVRVWSATHSAPTMITVGVSPEDVGRSIAEQAPNTDQFVLRHE